MKTELSVSKVLSDGFRGFKENFLQVFLTYLLYIITCWIPYLNVGTSIAIAVLPAKIAAGERIECTYIFDKRWFKFMGQYFILQGIMAIALIVAALFMLVPAIVMYLAWMFATLLLVTKDMNAVDALKESNAATFGNKWRLFAIIIIYAIIFSIIFAIFSLIPYVGFILNIILGICAAVVQVNMIASTYKTLVIGDDNCPGNDENHVQEGHVAIEE